jgi:histidinol-phosphate aminotransferase
MDLSKLVRPNILKLKPYSSARDEYQGEASVFLDANENPLNNPYNRYPDPLQRDLKLKVAEIKKADPSYLFFGNGSDEPIDLVYRVFCEPGIDNVVAMDPSYGMYGVCADINNVEYRKVLLTEDFDIDANKILSSTDQNTKVIFLCSPNNPTGNDIDSSEVIKILKCFDGIVVIDEAYIDFSERESYLSKLKDYPNLIVLQTFSKAWGLASVRLGMAFADPDIIGYFNKVKYPYNINLLTQNFVENEIKQEERQKGWVKMIVEERTKLFAKLESLPLVKKIYKSDANFILIKVDDANYIYNKLVKKGVIIRNRNNISLCMGCLRITVGTPEENEILLRELKEMC